MGRCLSGLRSIMESKIRKETILKGGSQFETRGLMEVLRVPVILFLLPRTHKHHWEGRLFLLLLSSYFSYVCLIG